ncbi:MAG: SDR family oxidoreductase [Planctomycetota bacterium]|nr:SDR family oxidoreductase [Planctomycetota bacterium]
MAETDESRVVLVTGAGGGIGRATAMLLAERGASLALLGRTASRLQETTEALPPNTETLQLEVDLADDEACVDAIDAIGTRFGSLDVIVNNAGVAPQVSIDRTDARLIRDTVDANLVGPIVLVSRAWPMLVASGGCVVNVSSMASIDPFQGFTAYAASKSGLDSLTRSIMAEAADTGIRAFTLNPGIVETPLLRTLFDETVVPKGAALEPREIAEEILACIDGRRDDRIGRPHPLLPGEPN